MRKNRRPLRPVPKHSLLLRLLIRLYPKRLRHKYGQDLLHLYQRMADETGPRHGKRRPTGRFQAALDTLFDVPGAHWDEFKRRRGMRHRSAGRFGAAYQGSRMFENLGQDLVVGSRALGRRLGWTSLVVVTLALGLSGVTAIATVVDDVLWQPLPYAEPARLVQLVGTENGELQTGATVAYLDVMDWREQSEAFAEVAAYDEWNPILTGSGNPVRLAAAQVTTSFFEVLGVRPALGRFFVAEEDEDGHDAVVVLDHSLWLNRFGADIEVVGRSILLNGKPHVVVGVTRASFEDPGLSGRRFEPPLLWRPLGYGGVEERRLPNRGSSSYVAVGRLRQAVSIEAAQAEIGTIAARLENDYPESNVGRGVALVPLRDRLIGDVRGSLLMLLIAMGCLLAIALLNVANLTVGRATERASELAVRSSLGASRAALLRPAMAEGLILGLFGGIGALCLARPLLHAIVGLAVADLPRADQIGMGPGTITTVMVVSMLVGAACAVFPVLPATRATLSGRLRSNASAGRSTLRLRGGLIATEVGLALVLITSGAVLTRSLLNLHQIDAGIDPRGVLTFDLSPPSASYPDTPKLDGYYQRVLEGLRSIPGVEAVAAVNIVPLSGGFDGNGLFVQGQPSRAEDGEWSVQVRSITPDYFAAVGTPLLEGRGIEGRDRHDTAPVVVINQAAVERFWPNGGAIGTRIGVAGGAVVIVGVVADTKHLVLDAPAPFQAYLGRGQGLVPWQTRRMSVVLRVDGDPLDTKLGLVALVRAAVWAVDDQIPLANLRSLQQVVDRTVSRDLLRASLVGAFALIAIALSVIGCYGVTSYSVSLRRRELALRMALGAHQARVLGFVVRQAARPAMVGLLLGIVGSWFAVRLLAGFLHAVRGELFVGPLIAPAFLGVVLIASLGPARRATRIDPMTVLREE